MSLPPLAQLTPNNNGPAAITVTYALIIVTILFCIIRVLTTFTLKRKFGWDDALLVVAVSIGLAQSIITEKSAVFGLGKHIDRLSAHQLDQYYKFSYASNLLWIFAQAAAKSSVIHLMSRLSAARSSIQKIYLGAHGVVLAWLIFSVFALAFQCGTPRPWVFNRDRCAGEGALWYPVIIFNILTDLALSFLFAPTVWKLQMALGQRITVMCLFAVRLFVCALSIAQLATLVPALKKDDFTRALTVPVVLEQIVMNFSILAAAAPSLHRFLNELHSGQGFATAIPASQYELSQGSGKGTWGKVRSAVKKRSTTNMTGAEKTVDEERRAPEFRPDTNRSHNLISTDPNRRRQEAGSELSGDGSEDMIIRQTKEYTISYDDHVQPGNPRHPHQQPHHQPHAM